MEQWIKHPDGKDSIAWDFAEEIPEGETLASGTISAINARTGEAAIVYASSSLDISGTTGTAMLQGGVDGQDYLVSFKGVLSDTQVKFGYLLLRVRAPKA